MLESFVSFCSTGNFIPHGHCFLWIPELVWLHVISDAFIVIAYFSIPFILIYFVYKRKDLPFKWVFALFILFIISCGTTHLSAIWTLWYPTYWLSGAIKAFTAIVSVATAILLVPLVPKALALPSAAQLREYNLSLETQVNRRTEELERINQQLRREIYERKAIEAELMRAKEVAETANRAKSSFLANMSHELRTPLNGILGYTQILGRDETLSDKQRYGVDIMQRSGDYLLTLINDILDLSKIEADRIEIHATDIHFEQFLHSIVELFAMRAQQKGVNFIYQPLTHLPTGVRTDETRLRQILINLLGNALKFTDHGQVVFKVGYDQDNIRFQIEDTGVGIAAEDLKNIFNPFQQVGENKRKTEGTGLGLTITQRLLKMLNANLHVESKLNQGSTFWFCLALPEVPHFAHAESVHTPPIIGIVGTAPKLLIVDDKPENRAVLVDLLAPLGFSIEETGDGREALDKALANPPDLILTDLIMPGELDGFELARMVRQTPALADVPIIAVSANVFEYNQQRSLAAGCNVFIAKPVHAEQLFAALQEWLKLKWAYGASTGAPSEAFSTNLIEDNAPLLPITSEQASTLYDLALRGDIIGVMDYAKQLAQEEPRLTHFVHNILLLANRFDDDMICTLVKPYLDEDSEHV